MSYSIVISQKFYILKPFYNKWSSRADGPSVSSAKKLSSYVESKELIIKSNVTKQKFSKLKRWPGEKRKWIWNLEPMLFVKFSYRYTHYFPHIFPFSNSSYIPSKSFQIHDVFSFIICLHTHICAHTHEYMHTYIFSIHLYVKHNGYTWIHENKI